MKESGAFPVFERVFKEFGLPTAIRTDNGVPFASAHALFGLSRLAVWWLRLGISIERIKPGRPQQNGRHERMHLTLKKEATKNRPATTPAAQSRFEEFIEGYNDRPHQSLEGRYPGELYTPSAREYFHPSLPNIPFPTAPSRPRSAAESALGDER
ncbi:MAG: integrase core domain-containing protein [Halioglobus sp.]